ncbi:MAG: hypothetical protein NT154_01480 [Verrucomicrobia bacterium]|nr:hypothetical protein [Verrucomicrobiota bacterium]
MILSGNTLYGTAERGGASGYGTVFSVNTDGSGFTTVYSFTAPTVPGGSGTNSDGAVPWSGVILSGNVLYGTATQGGSYGNGTIFAINTDGKGFTNLYNFTAVTTNSSGAYTNSDGGGPNELILSDNTLYGTAEFGGASGCGTVFSVNTDGSGFTNLYNFTADSDGFDPNALILSGNTLYRTAQRGGKNRNGTVFKVNTDDSGFTTLYRFTDSDNTGANSDGWWPGPGLVLAGDTLYGTSQRGGKYANGTVFSLTLPPPELKLTASGANIVLTWPTNATGFTLQSATALANGGDWQDSTLKVTVVGDQNVVTVDTTAPTAPAAFFRLRGP